MRFSPASLLLIPALLSALAFGGCPQHAVQMAEEILPPPDYNPVWLTSAASIGTMIEEMRKAGRTVGTSGVPTWSGSASGDTTGQRTTIAMDIRSVDDSRYPNQIELRAFVYDTSGRFVMGLAPPYFTGPGDWRKRWPVLIDSCNGVATPITNFTVTEIRQDKREPYAIAFVLDHSGSMGDRKIRALRLAVNRVMRIIKPGDYVAAVKFGSRAVAEVPLTNDTARYRHDFVESDIEPPGGGGTAIYDGATVGIQEVAKAPATHKRAIIVFTDGFDGESRVRIDSMQRLARREHVAIYTVAYGPADIEVMQNMAQYSSGRMYRIYRTREFVYVFADIYRALNNYYRITYTPPECNGVHTVTAGTSLPEFGFDPLMARGTYDRSVFTPFDTVGSIVLVNIEFDYDKATIRDVSLPQVREMADVMTRYPKLKLEIRGHTDDQGDDDYNQKLSQKRADAVADALVGMGISRSRLTVKGLGESQPLVPNTSDENRRRNRRTEFVIISR